TICGRRVSLNARLLIVNNAMASNALKFIQVTPFIDINQTYACLMQRACQNSFLFWGGNG
ncbi:hypothetical protein CWN35_28255, partial [Klebsiella pneumoniae]